jgi:hypothetical protein
MEILNHKNYPLKWNKHIAWVLTLILILAGIPFLKNVFALFVKLCELIISYGFGR